MIKYVVAAALLLLGTLCAGHFAVCATDASQNKILVVFRFDDYSARSNTGLETELLRIFTRHSIPCTFGVIPFVCAEDWDKTHRQELLQLPANKITILREAVDSGAIEVALHGYSHQRVRERINGELQGLPYEEQWKRLSTGKQFLETALGRKILTFVPPYGGYDYTTIDVLNNLGFMTLSAGFSGATMAGTPVKYLPATCAINRLKSSINIARHYSGYSPIVVVLFHEYEFTEVDKQHGIISAQALSALLDWVKAQPDIYTSTIKGVSDFGYKLNHDTVAKYKSMVELSAFSAPPFIAQMGNFCNESLFITGSLTGDRVFLFSLVFYLLLGLFGFGIAALLFTHIRPGFFSCLKLSTGILLFILTCLLAYTMRKPALGANARMLIAVLLGVLSGSWIGTLRRCRMQPGSPSGRTRSQE